MIWEGIQMPELHQPLKLGHRALEIRDLLHEPLRKLGYEIPQNELTSNNFGIGTQKALLKFQSSMTELSSTGVLDEITYRVLSRESTSPTPIGNSIEGRLFLDQGIPATNIKLKLYKKGLAGSRDELQTIDSDDEGFFSFAYGSDAANIEIVAVDDQDKEIPLTSTIHNIGKQEVMNLVVPTSIKPLEPEYLRLKEDLVLQLGTMNKLKDIKEEEGQQDLTILHESTGWDSRLIALASKAEKLSEDVKTNENIELSSDILYAMLRVGLPSDKQQLGSLNGEIVGNALKKANDSGILSIDEPAISKVKENFNKFSFKIRSGMKAPGAVSSMGEMLAKTALNNVEKEKFLNIFVEHDEGDGDLWKKVKEDADISDAKIGKLQLQGKLAQLTNNNALLTDVLQRDIKSSDNLHQLVDKGFYKASNWGKKLNTLASNDDELGNLIPSIYEAEKVKDRLSAYSEDLARKVRLSYPTRVVSNMIINSGLVLGPQHDDQKDSVHKFLTQAEGLGFKLGEQSVDGFIKNIEGSGNNTTVPVLDYDQETLQAVKKLSRLYQISPSNESLKVALEKFDSANEIVNLPYDEFMSFYEKDFTHKIEADLFYRKAEQINNVTLNAFTTAMQVVTMPQTNVTSASPEVQKETRENLIKRFPTLETLFGSLDYCECEHCRSVLSPAAYLVDVLQFLDLDREPDKRKSSSWKERMRVWKEKHYEAPYPFLNQEDWEQYKQAHPTEPDTKITPFEVLNQRRADIQHLPLTCENTHTALPYIDIVNEILEFYIAKGKLGSDAVHDTGDATTAELLAEPYNIIPEAYVKLSEAKYPLNLPFDLWLATSREFLDYFEIPLWKLLDTFRPSDKLYEAGSEYARNHIFIEKLGLSQPEYKLFTDTESQKNWYEYYGFSTEDAAIVESVGVDNQRIDLNSAKALSRRLGISYKEMVALVKTWFVNPNISSLGILKKLNVDVSDVILYKKNIDDLDLNENQKKILMDEKNAFTNKLEDLGVTFGFDTEGWINTAWEEGRFNQVLLLHDTSTACDFDNTTLQYADGTAADSEVFLRINLFVRLWKKLGWEIDEIDQALKVFTPDTFKPLTNENIGKAFETALVYLSHYNDIVQTLKTGRQSKNLLGSLWVNIDSQFEDSLYEQLFLSKNVLKEDKIFDHALGMYLQYYNSRTRTYEPYKWAKDETENHEKGLFSLQNHMLAIQGAIGLTVDEVKLVINDIGEKIESAALSMPNLSHLYRYKLLSKSLKISIEELISLKALSGYDPFKPLITKQLENMEDDHPFNHTLQFIELAQKIKESAFSIEELDYLLRHQYDPVGKYQNDENKLFSVIQSLTQKLKLIKQEYSKSANPISFTDEELKEKLTLVLPQDVVETFISMWSGTIEYEAIQSSVVSDDKLDQEAFKIFNEGVRVFYDDIKHEQHIIIKGVVTEKRINQIKGIVGQSIPIYFNDLMDDIHWQSKSFFNLNYLKQLNRNDSEFSGFLEENHYNKLFDPVPINSTTINLEKLLISKRKILSEAFLPFLQRKMAQKVIVETLNEEFDSDTKLLDSLISNNNLLGLISRNNKKHSLLDSIISLSDSGVTATYIELGKVEERIISSISTIDSDSGSGFLPSGVESVEFEGYMEVPASGAYRFFAESADTESLPTGVISTLEFEHLPNPVFHEKSDDTDSEISNYIELESGVMYRYKFSAKELKDSNIKLLVQGGSIPKSELSVLTLYPATTINKVSNAYTLLRKVILIIEELELSNREVKHILTHSSDFNDLDLYKIPLTRNAKTDDFAPILLAQLIRLVDYSSLKNELASGTEDLIDLFLNAHRVFSTEQASSVNKKKKLEEEVLGELSKHLAKLTRRTQEDIKETLASLEYVSASTETPEQFHVEFIDLVNEQGIRKLWDVFQLKHKLGLSVDVIKKFANPEPDADLSKQLRNMIKARFEQENWLRIAQPIFDKLRQQKRDALVAFIMHKDGFDRIEQLFEYFLIDPGMEPVVQTSRLRLAISSLQTFVQRCFLNLEPKVHSSILRSDHWEWMKRYRVWEANRKIFLFPENWLEPEFRDDKTHLFQELEGELLQGDVSNDLAEDAFFTYLRKLDEIARLDMITMYCEKDANDPNSETLHVIGRTYSEPHKYFYRRFDGIEWTPWEPVSADIEGDHVVAIVWKSRLHLFWVTFLVTPEEIDTTNSKSFEKMGAESISDNIPDKIVDVKLNWSEYLNGEWSSQYSGGFGILDENVGMKFESSKVFIHATKEQVGTEDGAVIISLKAGRINRAFRLINKNSLPDGVSSSSPLRTPSLGYKESDSTRYLGTGVLRTASFVNSVQSGAGLENKINTKEKEILNETGDYSLLLCPLPSSILDNIYERIANVINNTLPITLYNHEKYIKIKEQSKILLGFAESLPKIMLGNNLDSIRKDLRTIIGNFNSLIIDYPYSSAFYAISKEKQKKKREKYLSLLENTINQLVVMLTISDKKTNQIRTIAINEENRWKNPFFFQDSENTFFVRPGLSEQIYPLWNNWMSILRPSIKNEWKTSDWQERLHVAAKIPWKGLVPVNEDLKSLIGFKTNIDWLINPGMVLNFNENIISEVGRFDPVVLSGTLNFGDLSKIISSSEPVVGFPPGTGVGVLPVNNMNLMGRTGINFDVFGNANNRNIFFRNNNFNGRRF